ncbi:hypothetical protein ACH5RR_003952 [Cinchona calisaya]|uniref:Uncharacterized protein n=1 Tax=Cinchona calisaya TaxID=153742 RepID=A0ABD3AWL0_9GENT
MNSLDSTMEALAFDYLSFGLLTAVNNVWTWLAVITAAVSVWKFKASSSSSSSSSPRAKFPDEASPASETAAASTSTVVEAAKPSIAVAPSSPCVFSAEGRTSGKFIVYYDRTDDRCDDGNGEVNGEDGNVRSEKEWFGEVVMRMRMGNYMGFYRYQDLTVLDGSVVRLWDGCRRRNGSGCAIMQ